MYQLARNTPSLILLSLHGNSLQSNKPALLQKLKARFPTIPVITLAKRDSLEGRVAVARLGSDRHILKHATIDKVFEAIAQVLLQTTTTNAKVMINEFGK